MDDVGNGLESRLMRIPKGQWYVDGNMEEPSCIVWQFGGMVLSRESRNFRI